MKIAPLASAFKAAGIDHLLVHSGQHYDSGMSDVFFDELDIPRPQVVLGVGSDTHARQTARVMMEFERVCNEHCPDIVLVVGDVNSTMAAALVAAKLRIPVAHVEAGLRSFNRAMPEEINRVVTDHLSDLLFTTEEAGNQNLKAEGIPDECVHFVGNCMIDTLNANLDRALSLRAWEKVGVPEGGYAVATMHRPSNVDDASVLSSLIRTLTTIGERLPIVLPLHPRTRDKLKLFGIETPASVIVCDPQPYLSFISLVARARFVLTDSGGVQEETTALGVPCVTMREETERPATVDIGTNRLVGSDPRAIFEAVESVLAGGRSGAVPPLWDGHAAERIAAILLDWDRHRKR